MFGPYERLSQPLLHRRGFVRRLLASTLVGMGLILVSLVLGIAGYHGIVGLPWIDAYENAAMILAGMGPIAAPDSVAGKLFAGTYALYAGIAVLAIAGVIFAPIVHRFLHYLHADPQDPDAPRRRRGP